MTFSEAALERVEEAVVSGEIVNIDEKQLAPSKPVWVPLSKMQKSKLVETKNVLGCQTVAVFFGIESPMLILFFCWSFWKG